MPKPGLPAIVKLGDAAINGNTQPGGAPALGNTTTATLGAEDEEGAGFVSGMDNGVDPTADPLIDIGVDSSMRFLGIGANAATGQTRVPVVLTSIHDTSYGTTVRGITMNVAITGDTQPAADGDGGNIIFGSHTLTSYNLNDPRQGNLIDNVDLKYLSRVEQIGGGIIDLYNTNPTTTGYDTATEPNYDEKTGKPITLVNPLTGQPAPFFGTEYNGPNTMTISNSNFDNFRDFGFWSHTGFQSIDVPENYTGTVARGPLAQQAVQTFLVNDTFADMTSATAAVELDSNTVDDTAFQSPNQAILLNNTFYNNTIGINVNNPVIPGTTTTIPGALPGVAFNGQNSLSEVDFLAMNNIFDDQKTAAIDLNRQVSGSQGQYNLYFGNGGNVVIGTAVFNWGGDSHPVAGDPAFVDAANGNFNLRFNSAAINAARSELGPAVIGDMLFPAANQSLDASGGTLNFTGRSNPFGGVGFLPSDLDFVFLPGSPLPGYVTSWVPVLAYGATAPYAIPGPASNAGTWDYAPLPILAAGTNGSVVVPGNGQTGTGGGERDQNGVERYDYEPVPITGAGSQPYFDIGAYEFVQYFPPEVTGVTANFVDPTTSVATTKSIYAVGGVAGTNVAPQSIQVQFNHQIDPTTIGSSTVILEASSDGSFSANSTTTTINLAGKLTFNSATDVLTISLGASGLILGNDEYRLILVGTGSQELRDPQGNALDGANLDNTGAQKALPSGDGIPGGNFQLTFTIDTHPPAILPGTFEFAPTSYTNPDSLGTGITNQTQPTFQGTVTDIFPPANPVAGDTVFIDVSTLGNGVFNVIDAGVGTTDANGNFSIKLTTPLPQTNYNVGPDGLLGTADDTGYSEARVRVVDQSGNVSNTLTGTLQSFAAQGAVYNFVIDTIRPVVTSFTPTANTVAPVVNGTIPVTVTFNKNIDPKTLNTNTIQVVRSGGDGIFGNGNDVTMTIDPNSIKLVPIPGGGPLGPEKLTFNVIGGSGAPIANDDYQLTLKGSGAGAIEDIAGNPLGGGADFTTPTIVFSQSFVHNIFVGPATDITDPTQKQGTVENPFPTIAAGIAAAQVGDVVAVLPGVYTESITLKSLVTLESASIFSSDATVVPGDPLQTIIRAPQSGNPTTTITGTNLISAAGGALNSVLSGFTIASPLGGDPASGPIDNFSVGLLLTNSNVMVTDNYFVDSGQGAYVVTSGSAAAAMPTFINNVFAGNFTGVGVMNTTNSFANGMGVYNSDFAFNTYGLSIGSNPTAPFIVAANNIFWQNHSLDQSTGFAIGATNPNLVFTYSNEFADNGPNLTNPADDTFGIATPGGFNPANLTPAGDAWGNFTGEPAFVAPRDPRPGGDGPAVFFLDGNFDLTAKSAAINRANPTYAPLQDIVYRGRNGAPDVGAFEFNGTGGGLSGGSTFHAIGRHALLRLRLRRHGPVDRLAVRHRPASRSRVRADGLHPQVLVAGEPGDAQGDRPGHLRRRRQQHQGVEPHLDRLADGRVHPHGRLQQGGRDGRLPPRPSGVIKSTTGHALAGFNDTITLTTASPPGPPSPARAAAIPPIPPTHSVPPAAPADDDPAPAPAHSPEPRAPPTTDDPRPPGRPSRDPPHRTMPSGAKSRRRGGLGAAGDRVPRPDRSSLLRPSCRPHFAA